MVYPAGHLCHYHLISAIVGCSKGRVEDSTGVIWMLMGKNLTHTSNNISALFAGIRLISFPRAASTVYHLATVKLFFMGEVLAHGEKVRFVVS